MVALACAGVGISGQEGMQAVMSSDFAIAQVLASSRSRAYPPRVTCRCMPACDQRQKVSITLRNLFETSSAQDAKHVCAPCIRCCCHGMWTHMCLRVTNISP